jgi:hypothetical protein
MKRTDFLKLWSIAVGGMDASTGLLLVFFPASVLAMLGIDQPSADALVFLSWIGVFVMAVGLSYGLALGKRRSRGETVWMVTSLVRILVAVFLTFQIIGESMAMAWMLVAVADCVVALVQIAVLRAGWWKEPSR